MQDRRCRFGLAARIETAGRREAGESVREIAAGGRPPIARIHQLREQDN